MPRTPIIGITCDIKPEKGGTVFIYQRYIKAIQKAGGAPLLIPPVTGEALEAVVDLVAGVVVTGGDDLPASQYDAVPRHTDMLIDPARDSADSELFRLLEDRPLPVLGICYGMQRMCVVHKGKLFQHLPEDRPEVDHSRGSHPIIVTGKTELTRLLANCLAVPTAHHQGVQTAGNDMHTVAVAEDGVIEAACSDNGLWWGLQWHVEMDVSNAAIFAAFVEKCRP